MNNIKDFVAIDVETANAKKQICQIGIAVVRNREIVETRKWYVQPPLNYYEKNFINIHKITPEITTNEKLFDEVWEELAPYLVGQTLVAHHYETERDAFKQAFIDYPTVLPMGVNFNFVCTCILHEHRSLVDVCQAYGLDCENHHDAEYDALNCARILLEWLQGSEPDYSLVKQNKKNNMFVRGEKLKGDDYKMDLTQADPNSPFYKRKVVVTGEFSIGRKELGKFLKIKLGADVDSAITKKTNFVFIGDEPGPVKIEKLDKLIHDGYNIRKLYEKDLQAILNGDWEGYHMEKEIQKELNFTYEHFTKKHVTFENGRNVIANKELYFGKGLLGNRDLFAQITGNLGAFGNNSIYPDTNLCVLSISTLQKLKLGEKDETILYIQDYYNSNRSTTFDMLFISEEDILQFVKERIEKFDDENTGYYYRCYLGE